MFVETFIFLFSFSTYLSSVYPSLVSGDNPELLSSAYILGIPHTTGYPLYILFTKLISFLPIYDFAFKSNILSAFVMSLSNCLIYKILYKLTYNKFLSLLSALYFTLLYPIWKYATFSEVYPISLFFYTLLILYIIRLLEQSRILQFNNQIFKTKNGSHLRESFFEINSNYKNYEKKKINFNFYDLFILCLLCVLSILSHGSNLIFVFFIFLFLLTNRFIKLFHLPLILFLLLLFFSICVYFPLTSAKNYCLDWNNPETISNLIQLISGKDFRILTHSNFFMQVKLFLLEISNLFGIFLILLLLVGIFFSNLNKQLKLLFLISDFALIIFTFTYITKEKTAFYMNILPSLIIFITVGINTIKTLLGNLKQLKNIHTQILIVLYIIFLTFTFKNAFDNSVLLKNKFDNSYIEKSIKLITSLNPNSILFIDDVEDPFFSLNYLQIVKGIRKDLCIINRLFLAIPWYSEFLHNGQLCKNFNLNFPSENFFKNKKYLVDKNILNSIKQKRFINILKVDIFTDEIIKRNLHRNIYINSDFYFANSCILNKYKLIKQNSMTFKIEIPNNNIQN